jgi:hypothetical protein
LISDPLRDFGLARFAVDPLLHPRVEKLTEQHPEDCHTEPD